MSVVFNRRPGSSPGNQQFSAARCTVVDREAAVAPTPAATTYGTLCALGEGEECCLQQPDFEIVARILAESAARQSCPAHVSGAGLGLQAVLQSYERILPEYHIDPANDVQLYQLLLTISCDGGGGWWAKLRSEYMQHGFSQWDLVAHSASAVRNTSIPEDGLPFCTAPPTCSTSGPQHPPKTRLEMGGNRAEQVLSDISNGQTVAAPHEVTAEALHDFKLVSWCLSTWHHHTRVIQSSRLAKEQALQHWRAAVRFWELHLVRRCFHRMAQQAAAKSNAAAGHRQSLLLHKCMRAWRAAAAHAAATCVAAQQLLRRRSLQRAVQSWVSVCHQQQTQALHQVQAEVYHTKKLLRAVFAAWHAEVLDLAAQGFALMQAHRSRVRSTVFTTWRAAACDLKHLTTKAQELKSRNDTAAMQSCIQAWFTRYQLHLRRQALLAQAVAKMMNRTAAACFLRWRAFSVLKAQGRQRWMLATSCADASHRGRAWRAWRLLISKKLKTCQDALLAARFQRDQMLKMGLAALRLECMHKNAMLQVAEQALQQHQQQVARQVVSCWHGVWYAGWKRKQQAEELYKRNMLAWTAACLRAWNLHARIKQQLFQMGRDAQQHLRASTMANALRLWARFCSMKHQEQAKEHHLARYCADHLTGSVVGCWHGLVQQETSVARKTQELSVRRASTVLHSWQVIAHDKISKRNKAHAMQNQQQYQCKMACLHAWRSRTQQQSHLRCLMLSCWITAKEATLRGSMQCWRMQAVHVKVSRLQKAYAADAWVAGTSRRVFQHWAITTKHLAWQKQQLMKAKLLLVRRSWAAWQITCALARQQMVTAAQHSNQLYQDRLRLSVVEWHGAARVKVLQRQQVALASSHLQRKVLRHALGFWSFYSSSQQLQAARVSSALWCKAAATLTQVLGFWHNNARMRAQLRHTAEAVVAMVMGHKLLNAWLAWRAHFTMRQCGLQALAYWHTRHKKMAVCALSLAARRASRFHKVLSDVGKAVASSLLQQCFQQWNAEYLERKRQKKFLLFRAVYHWVSRVLAASLCQWRRFAAAQQHQRDVACACAHHWRSGSLQAALDAWRSQCWWKKQAAAAIFAMAVQRARLVLWLWHTHAASSSYLRACSMALQRRNFQSVVANCFAAWLAWQQTAVVKKHCMQRAEQFAAVRLLGTAWGAWLQSIAVIKMKQKHARSAMKRGFFVWRTFMQVNNWERATARQIITRHARLLLLQFWLSWKEYMLEQRAVHAHLLKVVQRWQQREASIAVQRWRLYVCNGHRKQSAIVHHRRHLMKVFMAACSSNVQQQHQFRRASRHHLKKVVQYWIAQARCIASRNAMQSRAVLHMQGKQLQLQTSQAFLHWKEAAKYIAHLRVASAGLTSWLHRTTSATCFLVWKATSIKQVRKQRAAAHHGAYLQAKCLCEWQALSWKLTRARMAKAFYMQHTIAGVVKFWKLKMAARHHFVMVASQLMMRNSRWLLKRTLSTWACRVDHWVMKRSLVLTAAVLCTRRKALHTLRAWKAAADATCKLRTTAQLLANKLVLKSLQMAWHCWRLQLMKKAKNRVVLQWWARKHKANLLQEWLHTASWRAAVRRKILLALSQWRTNSLCSSFFAWLRTFRQRRAVNHLLECHASTLKTTTLSSWLQVATMLHSAAALRQRQLVAMKAKVILCWRNAVKVAAYYQAAERALVQRLRQDESGLAQMLTYTIERWRNCHLHSAFDAWVSHVEDLADLRCKSAAAFAMLYRSIARKAWLGLLVNAEDRRSTRHAEMHWHHSLLSRWARYVGQQNSTRLRVAAFIHRLRQHKAHCCLMAWQLLAFQAVDARAKIQWHIYQVAGRCCLKVLWGWRAETELNLLGTDFLVQHMLRTLKDCFRSWRNAGHDQLAARTQAEAKVAAMLELHTQRRLASCFGYWQRLTYEQAAQARAVVWWALNLLRTAFYGWLTRHREVVLRGSKSLLKRSWCRWTAWISEACRARYQHALAEAHIREAMLVKGIASWAAWNAYAQQLRKREEALEDSCRTKLATHVLSTMQNVQKATRLHAAFVQRQCVKQWLRITKGRLDLLARCTYFQGMKALSDLRDSFFAWFWEVQEQRAQEQALHERQMAIAAAVNAGDARAKQRRAAVLIEVLHAWHAWAALLFAAQEMAWNVQHRVLRRACLAWLAAATKASYQRNLAYAFWAKCCLRTNWLRWRKATRQEIQLRLARMHQAAQLYFTVHAARVLRQWHNIARLSSRQKEGLMSALLAADAAAAMERKWAALEIWQKYYKHRLAAAELHLKAVQHHQHRMLHVALQGWHQLAAAAAAELQCDDASSSGHSLLSSASLLSRATTTPLGQDAHPHAPSLTSSRGSATSRPKGWPSLQSRPAPVLDLLSRGSSGSFSKEDLLSPTRTTSTAVLQPNSARLGRGRLQTNGSTFA